eukprot:3764838-Rhodomonas_salina.3
MGWAVLTERIMVAGHHPSLATQLVQRVARTLGLGGVTDRCSPAFLALRPSPVVLTLLPRSSTDAAYRPARQRQGTQSHTEEIRCFGARWYYLPTRALGDSRY